MRVRAERGRGSGEARGWEKEREERQGGEARGVEG